MKTNLVLQHAPCPSCPSSDAYCEWADGHGYCFSCKTYTNQLGSSTNSYFFEYLPWRNVSKETWSFFGCKTKVNDEGKPISIGFNWPNGSTINRLLDDKVFYTEGDIGKAGLFGRDKFSAGSHKYVTITEGALDAASLYQVLRTPVVAVRSTSTAVADVTLDRSWVSSHERIYLCFDNDAAGREALARVAKLFDYNKVFVVKLTKHKDVNEYLAAGETDELRNIWWNSKKFLPDTIISSFSDFGDILTGEVKYGVPYPFPTLTAMTYGIRTGESVLITAQEGVGKTEMMHAIEHKLLKETKDAVGAIFLEEPKKRHLQALAGIHLNKPAHLPDGDCSDDQALIAVKEVVGEDERLHIYSHFGSDDPEVIIDTIRFLVSARNCKYILLDHISMVVSGLAGDNETKALDYLSTRLEMLVKELDFALIYVSHVNDHGLTRGSRYISKVADIRIDLDRDVKAGSMETFISVSKNRYCGRTGPAGKLVFDPITYTLSEELYSEQDPSFGGSSGGEQNAYREAEPVF